MPAPTGKTFLPTAAVKIDDVCKFVTKHGPTIIAVTEILSPTDVAAMSAAITAIQAACALIQKIEALYDPYQGKTTARPEP